MQLNLSTRGQTEPSYGHKSGEDTMSRVAAITTVTRTQTTVSLASDALEAVDELARMSGVSRSRLIDLAVRRFIRWAVLLQPRDIRLIADYEVGEPVSPTSKGSGTQPATQTKKRSTRRPEATVSLAG